MGLLVLLSSNSVVWVWFYDTQLQKKDLHIVKMFVLPYTYYEAVIGLLNKLQV